MEELDYFVYRDKHVHKFYYYRPCPLGLQDADESQVGDYRVLPVDSYYAGLEDEKYQWKPAGSNIIGVGSMRAVMYRDYPSAPYRERAWVLHEECLSRVLPLSTTARYQLLDLVEPTFLSRSSPPASAHGAFYSFSNSRYDQTSLDLKSMQTLLPQDVWDIVEQYDIGRLLFVLRTALQLR